MDRAPAIGIRTICICAAAEQHGGNVREVARRDPVDRQATPADARVMKRLRKCVPHPNRGILPKYARQVDKSGALGGNGAHIELELGLQLGYEPRAHHLGMKLK